MRYTDGSQETVQAGQAFHWPAGHTVWTDEGFESLQISPQAEMHHTLEHVRTQLGLVATDRD